MIAGPLKEGDGVFIKMLNAVAIIGNSLAGVFEGSIFGHWLISCLLFTADCDGNILSRIGICAYLSSTRK